IAGYGFQTSQEAFAAAFADGKLHFYDLVTGKTRKQMAFTASSFSFSPVDTKMVAATKELVEIWDWQKGALEKSIKHPGLRGVPAWHPSGRFLACLAGAGKVTILNWQSAKVQATFETPDTITAHAFNHRGDWLVTHGWKQTIRFWDARSGKEIMQYP